MVLFEFFFKNVDCTGHNCLSYTSKFSTLSCTICCNKLVKERGKAVVIILVSTRNFVFRFETERVEYPEIIWNLDSYSHNAEQSNLKSSNLLIFSFRYFKIKISFFLKINTIWKINFCSRWDLGPRPLDFATSVLTTRPEGLVIENESIRAITPVYLYSAGKS